MGLSRAASSSFLVTLFIAFAATSHARMLLQDDTPDDTPDDAPDDTPDNTPVLINTAPDPTNVARACANKYWASPQALDSFGCLSKKISCVDVVMSGATTSVPSLNENKMTDQD
jgi:hypothetical protein